MLTCNIDGCDRPPTVAGGMCSGHYERVRRTGDPGPATFRRKISPGATADELLRFIGWNEAAGGCWEWRGRRRSTKSGGHGVVDFRQQSRHAHRLAYETWVGAVPVGHVVMHRCDNPVCINPAHLRVGTQADNMHDRDNKGRHAAQKRTHCTNGHEFTPENTRWVKSQTGTLVRKCRTCGRLRDAERYRRARAETKHSS